MSATLLDYYTSNDPTSALTELDDLGAVDLSRLAWTSVRGIAALSEPFITVFDEWDTQCPTPKTDRYVDRQTGEIIEEPHLYWSQYLGKHVEAPCNRNSCPACAVRKARKIAGAIYVSRPRYVLTLTLVGDDYEDIRKRMGRFFDAIRRMYPTLRYLWTAENNPAATGTHAHAYVHLADSSISQVAVHRAASRTGVGSVDITPVPITARATYMGYGMKDLLTDKRDEFLALNGRPERQFIVHPSRGFYRDGATGKNLSRSQAESLALSRSR